MPLYSMAGYMIRTIGIWLFGLLASGIVGGLIGAMLTPNHRNLQVWGETRGVLAGLLAFTCLRLWLDALRAKNSN